MKVFEYPKIEIVKFEVEDVITTSLEVERLENMTDKG